MFHISFSFMFDFIVTLHPIVFFLQSSGQQIPVVVESCIRFINLHGESVFFFWCSTQAFWEGALDDGGHEWVKVLLV